MKPFDLAKSIRNPMSTKNTNFDRNLLFKNFVVPVLSFFYLEKVHLGRPLATLDRDWIYDFLWLIQSTGFFFRGHVDSNGDAPWQADILIYIRTKNSA